MAEYFAKKEYEIFKKSCKLDKDQLLDKIFELINKSNIEDSLEQYPIIEAFKKMNNREYHLSLSNEYTKSDVKEYGLVKFTGKEDPPVRGNQNWLNIDKQ